MGKLLILDDEITIAMTVATIAELAGIEARITTDPAEFFRLLDEWHPTHIALDLIMPEMDGVEVMVSLAKRRCEARIIITSGVGSRVLDAAGRSAAEHGLHIAGMLSKPFSPAALRALLLDPDARLDSRTGMQEFVPPGQKNAKLGPDDLRRALAENQLFLVYQPQVSAETNQVVGFEALVRWRHPVLGTVMPDSFIPMAESSGLIDQLTDRVLELGLDWLSRSFPDQKRAADGATDGAEITLSVNMSASTLGDRDFVQEALRACELHGVEPTSLILELTETSAMRDPAASLDQLTRLRMKGFQLSIDDFGTGFSSMLQLARLPFSELKVDKSFVMTAMQSMESRAVVRSVIDLGRSLGLRTVAEGVEDATTLDFLRGIGCDVVQGYFIARPMPAAEVAAWMATNQDAAAAAGAQPARNETAQLEQVQAFQWSEQLLTGIKEVDQQHEHLVGLIKQFGRTLLPGEAHARTDSNTKFAELVEYAGYHFREEEQLMAEQHLDTRHIDFHRSEHASFLAEVLQIRESAKTDSLETLQSLTGFLFHWLGYHVLGVDQSMSRQITAIRSGKSPAEAFFNDRDRSNTANTPLLQSVDELFRLATARNRELHDANRKLEQRATERTTALSEANQRLAVIAMTDPLTGIPNRRHAFTILARAWEDALNRENPVACLIIDADNLKPTNDLYGHEAGDKVLRQLALKLRDAIRTDDVACRLGGDEFLIVAPLTPMAGALQLAEKIRREVSELAIPTGEGHWPGSVSIGVAVREGSMSTPEELIRAADEALFIAKRAGRNQVATPSELFSER